MRRRVERCALTPLSKNGCGKTTLVIEATRRGPASGVWPTHHCVGADSVNGPPLTAAALPLSCAATQASVADAVVQAHLAVTEAASGIGVVALREIAIRRVEDEVDLAAFGVDTFTTRVKKGLAPRAASARRGGAPRPFALRDPRAAAARPPLL